MHTYMDAKLMAKLLRQALAERGTEVSHSDCLEMVARQFGFANWNILSAKIDHIDDQDLLMPEGWVRTGASPRFYRCGLDRSAKAALIENLPEFPRLTLNDFCTLMQSISAEPYRNKRIRLVGEIRTEDAADGGTIWMRIDSEEARNLRFDNLETRRDGQGVVKGTTGWTKREITFDVPQEAASIHFGFFLKGTGSCWAKGFELDVVDETVPTTQRQKRFLPEPKNLDFQMMN